MKELIKKTGINDLVVNDIIYHLKDQPEVKLKLDKCYTSTSGSLPEYFTSSTSKSSTTLRKEQKGYSTTSTTLTKPYIGLHLPISSSYYEGLKQASKSPAYLR